VAPRRAGLASPGRRAALAAGLGLAAGLAAWRAPVAQQPPKPGGAPATLTYRILRDGLDLGRQSMVFRQRDGATEVEVVTHVQVTVGGMQVYEFQQEIQEVWRDRRLVRFSAHANDNGARHTVELSPSAGQSLLVADGRRSEVPAEVASSTLWHPFMLKRKVLFDTLHGDLRDIRVREEGEVVLRVGGRDQPARLYVLTGAIKRKLWYAVPGDQLLRMALTARDGSEVVFEVVR